MANTRYLNFEGLNHSVALENAAPLETMVSEVLSAWPHQISATQPQNPPFVTIRPADDGRWSLVTEDAPSDVRIWDSVNTVCDLVAEMAWERLRSEPELLCLHAAAVNFDGRLVVFPNARRAGKSTLAIALARLGRQLYTDDFLPVRIDASNQTCLGIANGAPPRIRLPVPKDFSDAFHAWVGQDRGPSNRQYKYLLDAQIAPHGETLPLGAMVVLDRQDDPVEPVLAPMAREDALESLISQNFARTRHAGAILKSIDVITRHLPIYRLSYHSGEAAAEYLSGHSDLKSLPATRFAELAQDDRQAPLNQIGQSTPEFAAVRQYVQATNVTETQAGNDSFLADGTGLAIFRLNPVSTAIWRLLEEPTDLDEVVSLLAAAFPDVPADQITTDCEQLMRGLAEARLILPVASKVAAQ